jgi:hypothetical protein
MKKSLDELHEYWLVRHEMPLSFHREKVAALTDVNRANLKIMTGVNATRIRLARSVPFHLISCGLTLSRVIPSKKYKRCLLGR